MINYYSTKILSLKEYKDTILQLSKISNRKMQWIKLIENDKLICPISNTKVTFCSLDENRHKNGNKSYHYNFYNEKFELMTIDHIIPKSKGGRHMDINNLQPMLNRYNQIKDDTLDLTKEEILKRDNSFKKNITTFF